MSKPARRVTAFLALATGALALAAPAQAAPGEIMLHITARGSVAPDFLTLPVPVSGSGPTREEAEASLKLQHEQILKEMTDAGIDTSAAMLSPIETAQEAWACAGESDACAAGAAAAAAATGDYSETGRKLSKKEKKKREEEAAAAMAAARWTASATLSIEVDVARLPELQKRGGLSSLTAWPMAYGMGTGSLFSFRDRAAAHASALDKAMASARTEADAYAGALGYKVVRIAGASNAPAPFSAADLATLFGKMDGAFRDPAFMNSEVANVTIDFVIAPR